MSIRDIIKNKLYMEALKLRDVAKAVKEQEGSSITGMPLKPHKSILLKRAARKMRMSELVASH